MRKSKKKCIKFNFVQHWMNYEAKIVVTFKLEEFIELWNSIYSKIISYLNCYKNDIFFLQNFV